MDQDRTGLTKMHSLDAAQNVYRVALFLLATILLLIVSARRHSERVASAPLTQYIAFLALGIIFVTNSIIVITFSSELHLGFRIATSEVLRSLYFFLEWVIVVVATHLYFAEQLNDGIGPERTFVTVIRMVGAFYVLSVLVLFMFSSYIAYGATGRLGGFVIHPNKLAVVATIGAICAYYFSNGLSRVIGVSAYSIVAILTMSRSVILGSIVALTTALIFSRTTMQKKLFRISWVIFFGFVLVGLSFLYTDQILEVALRGQDQDALWTLNDRIYIWLTSLNIISDHPLTGIGYYFGPKHLWEFYSNATSIAWRAPHAHNEILNATLSGGILAGIVVIILYARMIIRSLTQYSGNFQTLMLSVSLILFFHSLATPILSEKIRASGMFLVFLYSTLAYTSNPMERAKVCLIPMPSH